MRRHLEVSGKVRNLQGCRVSRPTTLPRRLLASSPYPLPPRSENNRDELKLRVEDQEWVGCCVGEGVTSAMEAALKRIGVEIHLSALWIYYLTRKAEGTPPNEDSGCEIPNAVRVAEDVGCALDVSWPFVADRYSEEPPTELQREAATRRLLLDFECDTDEETKYSLVQGFPVVCGYDVPKNQMTAESQRSGLVHRALEGEGYAGGHCVLIVDYDDEKNCGAGDVGAWLCLNSWGEGYGDGGYFWLSYACRPRDRFTFRRVA